MNILIASGTHNCANLGDVAMLQAAVGRLRAQWPEAAIGVLTDTPERVAAFCPEAAVVPAGPLQMWTQELSLLGRFHGRLPPAAARPVAAGHHLIKERWPELLRLGLNARAGMRRQPTWQMRCFWKAVDTADLFVVCGAGGFADHSRDWNEQILDLLALAARRQKPAVLLGQGFGPISDRAVIDQARRRFPDVALVTLRESLYALEFVRTVGVAPDRFRVTGDEAIEAAWQQRPATPGASLGVNLRVSRSSAVSAESAAAIVGVLRRFASGYGCPMLPVPIDPSDRRTLQTLIGSAGEVATPLDAMRAAGCCRVVVTGAYHAAVFALSQGVPAVCLAASAYFETKFRGLANQFGSGCQVLPVAPEESLPQRLYSAVESAWRIADSIRGGLLQAADAQIRLQHAAYFDLAMAVDQRPVCGAAGGGTG
jgi:colanic acid/amylovoran biosynthesis protein